MPPPNEQLVKRSPYNKEQINKEAIMIDDEEKTEELLSKLTAELPIKAYPGQGLIEMMKKSALLPQINRDRGS